MPRVDTSGVDCEARCGCLAVSIVLAVRVPDACVLE